MTEWKTVRGDREPEALDTTTSNFVVYERRNIRQESVADPDGTERPVWAYEEREYTKEEYAQLNSPATQAILNAVSQAAEDAASWDALNAAIQEGVNSVA